MVAMSEGCAADLGSVDAPLLVLGARGMLGRAWVELLDQEGASYLAGGRELLDISDPLRVCEVVDSRYRAVVNCCAYTDVDGAEDHQAEACRINGDGVANLAQRCRDTGALLIHYSTDYVFDGKGTSPYSVDSAIAPLNAYGRSKALGERYIGESGCRSLVVRSSWLYAPWGKNFVRTIAAAASQREVLRVVDDQRGRPSSCEQLAAATLALARSGAAGSFHLCDSGECTWFEFAQEIVRLGATACRVDPCSSDEFPRPAPRPGYSVLDLTLSEARVGPLSDWKKSLAAVFDRLE